MIDKTYDAQYKERARNLVAQMTLEEKFTQMTYRSQAIPRLGIPAYNWWNEALHGVARAGVATMFPQAIGLAAMFDEDFMEQLADVISTEGRAKYHAFSALGDRDIYKGLTFWSPNVNIFRDPRWGRGHETYGEDPYLTSRMGVAFVKGLQGDDPKYLKAAACAKHFAVHSGPEKLRHEFDAEASQKDLWETYLPAFEALVKEAKVESVMGAYNRTNGEPCCGSKTLIRDILRGKWGFDGHFVSDCWAIKDFHTGHHVTATAPQSAAMALEAGCDVNCGVVYLQLQIAYNEGLVTEEQIDQALVRLFTTRMRLGLFDQDVPYADIPYEANNAPEHATVNLTASEKSMVLLKNEGVLPLHADKIRKLAVIGPNADSRTALTGNYHGDASRYTTVLEGIEDRIGADKVIYAQGCNLWRPDTNPNPYFPGEGFAEAILAVQHADAAVVVLGLDETLEGEEMHESNAWGSGDKYGLQLPGHQEELLETVVKAADGKPVILLMMTGSSVDMAWADEHVSAILQTWYPGSRGGEAAARILFGDVSPAGRLPVTFYRSTEELPEFTDYSMKGRTYRYMEQEALYPFGYGLSYTKFQYDALSVCKTEDGAEAEVVVRNCGTVASDEVVQLYLKHHSETTSTPRWSLKGFKRVHLEPGEETTVKFHLRPLDLETVQDDGSRVVEKGLYQVYVGGGQPDPRTEALTGQQVLTASFEI